MGQKDRKRAAMRALGALSGTSAAFKVALFFFAGLARSIAPPPALPPFYFSIKTSILFKLLRDEMNVKDANGDGV
eukprot:scaffold19784_cov168-Skeletonema_dohrnii-CCMP3373.AAC.2